MTFAALVLFAVILRLGRMKYKIFEIVVERRGFEYRAPYSTTPTLLNTYIVH